MTTETPPSPPAVEMDTDADVENQKKPMDTDDVVEEVVDKPYGALTGNAKWFSNKLGYGFVTVVSKGPHHGRDIFCHHLGIHPSNSKFRTLIKGEYINFDIEEGQKGDQAVNITGIMGGALLCDNNISYAGGPQAFSGSPGNFQQGQNQSFDQNVVGVPTYTPGYQGVRPNFPPKKNGYSENYTKKPRQTRA
jgi:CspA family cold shock protein